MGYGDGERGRKRRIWEAKHLCPFWKKKRFSSFSLLWYGVIQDCFEMMQNCE